MLVCAVYTPIYVPRVSATCVAPVDGLTRPSRYSEYRFEQSTADVPHLGVLHHINLIAIVSVQKW
jgi:hypothetical protein